MAPLVEILVGVAGDDFGWRPGELVDMSDEDAANWADGDRARLASAQPNSPLETTEQPPAATPGRSPRRESTTPPPPETTEGRPAAPARSSTRKPSPA